MGLHIILVIKLIKYKIQTSFRFRLAGSWQNFFISFLTWYSELHLLIFSGAIFQSLTASLMHVLWVICDMPISQGRSFCLPLWFASCCLIVRGYFGTFNAFHTSSSSFTCAFNWLTASMLNFFNRDSVETISRTYVPFSYRRSLFWTSGIALKSAFSGSSPDVLTLL